MGAQAARPRNASALARRRTFISANSREPRHRFVASSAAPYSQLRQCRRLQLLRIPRLSSHRTDARPRRASARTICRILRSSPPSRWTRLIAQFEKVRRVHTAMVADTLARRYHGRAAQAEFAGQMDEPVGNRLAAMTAIVLGEKRDLVAVHVDVSPALCDAVQATARKRCRLAGSPALIGHGRRSSAPPVPTEPPGSHCAASGAGHASAPTSGTKLTSPSEQLR